MYSVTYSKRPNVELLGEQLRALNLAGYQDVSWTGVELEVIFLDRPSPEHRSALDAAVQAHDANQKTARQLAAEQDVTNENTIRSTARTLAAKADADVTAAEVKTLILLIVRFLIRRGWL